VGPGVRGGTRAVSAAAGVSESESSLCTCSRGWGSEGLARFRVLGRGEEWPFAARCLAEAGFVGEVEGPEGGVGEWGPRRALRLTGETGVGGGAAGAGRNNRWTAILI